VDRIGHTTRLADTHTYSPTIVAYHRHDAEAEPSAPLDNLGDSRYIHYVLIEFVSFFELRHSASILT
jgi:hypothetical protein